MGQSNYIKEFTDIMSDGFIYIDKDKTIRQYNKKAKEIFGISNTIDIGHDAGHIGKGDIVIIADTDIGRDDGGLDTSDLKMLGIHDSSIKCGDAIVAIASYCSEEFKPVYKTTNHLESIGVEQDIKGSVIETSIDVVSRSISITIDDKSYELQYFDALGHMVILDSKDMTVRFYQLKGYTARRESIKEILQGKHYSKKKAGDEIEVIGRTLYDIHEKTTEFSEFVEGVINSEQDLEKQLYINGYPVICYAKPLYNQGKMIGLMLRLKDIRKLTELIEERDNAIRRLREVINKQEHDEFHRVIGNSKGIVNIKRLLKKASATRATVLLLGDSGTGKSFIAREIHENSDRKEGPFVHINCGSIPDSLIESEFFGYVEGAFTGARSGGKDGYFSIADGGTIFLDEIGEIPISLQAKLLKVIQDRSFYPVGGSKEKCIDVRIIAATNKDLQEETRLGRFREDLYYRVNVLPIIIPSLNERAEDIEILVSNRLPIICNRLEVDNMGIDPSAIERLKAHDFKGNVRELENILERAVVMSDGDCIMPDDLGLYDSPASSDSQEFEPQRLKDYMKEQERRLIIQTLEHTKGDKKAALKILGIGKTSFYEKLKQYDINI